MAMPEDDSDDDDGDNRHIDTSVADLVHLLRSDGFVLNNIRLLNVSQRQTAHLSSIGDLPPGMLNTRTTHPMTSMSNNRAEQPVGRMLVLALARQNAVVRLQQLQVESAAAEKAIRVRSGDSRTALKRCSCSASVSAAAKQLASIF